MSIYTALSGAVAAEKKIDLIANNLANVNTNGFKRDSLTFKEYLTELEKEAIPEASIRSSYKWEDYHNLRGFDKSFVDIDTVETDYSQGSIVNTGRNLDLAINGAGFFAISTPMGIAFTRNGAFSLDSQGRLVTKEGFPVLTGTGDFINEDGFEEIFIRGNIHFDKEGGIYQDGEKLYDLLTYNFTDKRALAKQGGNLYLNTDPIINETFAFQNNIISGALEGSNVNPLKEMVDLISANRAFESYQNVIKSFDEINSKAIDGVGRLIG